MAQGLEPSTQRRLAVRLAASAGLGVVAQAVMIGGFLLQGNAADVRFTLILACVAFFFAALAAPAGGKRVDGAAVAVVVAVGVGLALGLSAFDVAWNDGLQLALFGAAAAGGG
jgi:hypothetical protein